MILPPRCLRDVPDPNKTGKRDITPGILGAADAPAQAGARYVTMAQLARFGGAAAASMDPGPEVTSTKDPVV